MRDSKPPTIETADLPALTKAARLDLATARNDIVAPALEDTLQLLDILDAVDVGETPPTNSFDARWRTKS